MRFIQTTFSGVYLIEPEPNVDVRGFFARIFCEHEFSALELCTAPVQCNISYNKKSGTLRGMHFQRKPHGEAKLVRCTAGAIYDVIIDLRQESTSFMQWSGYKLTADNRNSLYIPEGFAHGFQTLTDNTEVFYQMFSFYSPNTASGVRWNDSAFKIKWPLTDPIISEKDLTYPNFDGFCL